MMRLMATRKVTPGENGEEELWERTTFVTSARASKSDQNTHLERRAERTCTVYSHSAVAP